MYTTGLKKKYYIPDSSHPLRIALTLLLTTFALEPIAVLAFLEA